MAAETINFKIDADLKSQFVKLSKDLGLTTTSFLTMFIKKAIDEQGAPFEVKVSNPLPKVYQQLIEEEDKKILGLIPDDAEDLTDEKMAKWKAMYQ